MYTEEEDSLSSPGVFARRRNPVFPHHFHITPFLARHRRHIMNLNPMAHGTENATQSVYHPVVDLCRQTLFDTSASGLQNSRSENHYKDTAEEAQSIQVLAPQSESKARPPKVQEGRDRHGYDVYVRENLA